MTDDPAPETIYHDALRAEAREAPESGIVEVFSYGRNRPGLIPLWVGEGDLPTPAFIADAASRSLAAGETFYTYQRGVPELRAALAGYHQRTFGGDFTSERFFVTGGGMQAIQIAVRMVAGNGDEVVVPTPCWPNITAAVGIAGAQPIAVPMAFAESGWTLDLDRLFDAATDRTTAFFINSPSNPTGWTASRDQLEAIASFAAKRGIWIIADEVYNRYFYDGPRAASFYDFADRDDRLLFVNTFSKNYAMTGWRIGWLSAPPVLGQTIENLIQYATSGVATFMQRAATVALDEGNEFILQQVARADRGRRILCERLVATGRARLAMPQGAFYLFFAIDGEADSRRVALRLVDEANVGVAPGTAFGDDHGFLRLCFSRRTE
ncbi:MAG: aminotransferase class I/II-fold pyridoxal phosphate-dependent enzyme, partial [Hyphomicrobiales bacterium]|nr:aminotransferase class I/II-fold pyridoxal phosphate-dependent enzyme [Hyphomicrobiales bacterium]